MGRRSTDSICRISNCLFCGEIANKPWEASATARVPIIMVPVLDNNGRCQCAASCRGY